MRTDHFVYTLTAVLLVAIFWLGVGLYTGMVEIKVIPR